MFVRMMIPLPDDEVQPEQAMGRPVTRWKEAPDCCCPACGDEWEETDLLHDSHLCPGLESQCPSCGALLELCDFEVTVYWRWAVRGVEPEEPEEPECT
jgi:hypothetical protein